MSQEQIQSVFSRIGSQSSAFQTAIELIAANNLLPDYRALLGLTKGGLHVNDIAKYVDLRMQINSYLQGTEAQVANEVVSEEPDTQPEVSAEAEAAPALEPAWVTTTEPVQGKTVATMLDMPDLFKATAERYARDGLPMPAIVENAALGAHLLITSRDGSAQSVIYVDDELISKSDRPKRTRTGKQYVLSTDIGTATFWGRVIEPVVDGRTESEMLIKNVRLTGVREETESMYFLCGGSSASLRPIGYKDAMMWLRKREL